MSGQSFLVTGGAGFIGSNFVRMLALQPEAPEIVVLDALTYAGNLSSLQDLIDSGAVRFIKADICDEYIVAKLLAGFRPEYIVNFAAETHVDRSVTGPRPFERTNVRGTLNMLECARLQRDKELADKREPSLKKFVQIGTDEVYGDLEIGALRHDTELSSILGRDVRMFGCDAFTETTRLNPSSPYSATKASADMLALSYYRTFGLPVCVTRCSNNYGPYQFPEKLIPLAINNLSEGRPIPVYGRGLNVRDWIHVDDHCAGVLAAALDGRVGEVYNFGGYGEMQNIELVYLLIDAFVKASGKSIDIDEAITYVTDRPGHDRRYAIDARKAMGELGWRPKVDFARGIADTVRWYVDRREWVEAIANGSYRDYYEMMYSNRVLR